MEEEEPPRKMQKLDHGESNDVHSQEDLEPVMTEAINPTEAPAADEALDEASTPAEIDEAGDADQDENKESEGAQSTLSKSQLKKLRRQQRWEEKKQQRKIWRKEKRKARREKKRAEAQEAGQNAQETGSETSKAPLPTRKELQLRSVLLPITFVIDCSFDDLMLDKERTSLASQITRSYSDNSKAPYRGHLAISTFDKLLKRRFDTVLCKQHEKWKGVHFMQEDFVHAANVAKDWMTGPQGGKLEGPFADKADATPEDGEIVYLSSESPHTLTELKPYSTYIIGGLVDKNRHKGICYKRATERGIKTAKLPIGDYMQMSTRFVLATNHVVEIMLKWLELRDWGEAFMQVMPKRKGGVLKENRGQDANEANEADESADEEEAADGNAAESKDS